ncbi:MAG: hypothetical protein ACT4TC_21010 [Myxococcaceae bacterium]
MSLHRLAWSLVALAWIIGAGCSHSALHDGRFQKGDVRYRVGPLPETWRQVRFAENDLAFVSKDGPQSIAINSTCEDHADPPLEVLIQHLLVGFTDRQRLDQTEGMLDGRESLTSHFTAKLDGVPMELLLVVMKKDGCIYDFTYLSPPARFEDHRAVFNALVQAFHAEPRR